MAKLCSLPSRHTKLDHILSKKLSSAGISILMFLRLRMSHDNGVRLGTNAQRIVTHDFPVIEHALRERLSTSLSAQLLSESEGFQHGK